MWGGIKCPKCSASNPGTANKCGVCGQSFHAAAASSAASGATSPPAIGSAGPPLPVSSGHGVFAALKPVSPVAGSIPAGQPQTQVSANAIFGMIAPAPVHPAAPPMSAPAANPPGHASVSPFASLVSGASAVAPPVLPRVAAWQSPVQAHPIATQAPARKPSVRVIAIAGAALVAAVAATWIFTSRSPQPSSALAAVTTPSNPTTAVSAPTGGPCRGAIGTGSADPGLAECVKAATVLLEIGVYDADDEDYRRHLKVSHGTGFLVDDHGLIATARHVVSGEITKQTGARYKMRVSVLFADRTRVDAVRCLADDDDTDLSILRIDKATPRYLRLSDEDKAAEMTPVLVVGHPLDKERWSFSRGDISSRTTINDHDFYGVTARVEPGNSGGPVMLTSTLEVIGVADAKVKGTGLSYAVPVKPLRKLIQGHRDDDGKSCGAEGRKGF